MGIENLEDAIGSHRLLLLDTPVFSCHFSNHPRYAPLTTVILGAIESGRAAGLTSAITAAEILTFPAQADNQRTVRDYELFLANFPNLHVAPLDVTLAFETALV